MVDSTYLLPSLGISVKGLEAEDIRLIDKFRESVAINGMFSFCVLSCRELAVMAREMTPEH